MVIKIKPFYTAIIFYFFANLLFFVLAISDNTVTIEYETFYVDSFVLWSALFIQNIALAFIVIIYLLFKNKKFKEVSLYGDYCGVFLLIWQLFFLYLAFSSGLGVVGSENKVNQVLVVISNFLSADIFYILMASSLKSNKLFFINTLIYLFSTLIRGWIGGLVIVFFVYLCRVGYLKVSIKTFTFYFLFFIFMLVVSPFIVDFKIAARLGEDFELDFKNYGEKLEISLEYVLGRFQHIGHIAILLKHANEYRLLYDLNQILPYWIEGIPQNFLYKYLGYRDLLTYSNMMAVRDFGAYSTDAWNANTGFGGWLILLREKSILLFFYWIMLIFPLYMFLHKYGNKQTFNIVSIFTVIYLYHGWFGAFFNLILLVFIVVFLSKIKINKGKR